ncbi:DUF2628 domain-containing protein [Desulfovibrio litoralis]|uniref:DUF2628 domain-containing protein n=1 Tax=Desulfovibrio litoralis DSM 11393 TaxID=1121455 RepID=A0A1M7TF95_9BACT|nr:DUF2628 domain-containing protein [Desulfovibrio litoralis]SHN69331.1 Protein of unknown function [Desulfovibrio litoralis DSM 11393]
MQNPTEQSQEQAHPQTEQQAKITQTDQNPNGEFPPHIAYLDVSLRVQKAFMLIEKYKMHSPEGIMMSPQDKNNAPTFSEKMAMFSWLTLFFTFWYYLFTGMWRKGLVIMGVGVFLAIAFESFTPSKYMVEKYFIATCIYALISIAFNILWAKTAFYDRYRTIVKKEVFWW